MASSPNLHEVLCEVLNTRNVYYNPPESVKMMYPAIVYSRRDIEVLHANDRLYKKMPSYEVTIVHEDPDDGIVDRLLELPTCRYDRHFVSDNLHHDTFTLYF